MLKLQHLLAARSPALQADVSQKFLHAHTCTYSATCTQGSSTCISLLACILQQDLERICCVFSSRLDLLVANARRLICTEEPWLNEEVYWPCSCYWIRNNMCADSSKTNSVAVYTLQACVSVCVWICRCAFFLINDDGQPDSVLLAKHPSCVPMQVLCLCPDSILYFKNATAEALPTTRTPKLPLPSSQKGKSLTAHPSYRPGPREQI